MGTAAERDAVHGKIKIAGHPVHPMLVALPVACYAGTLAGSAVYAANGHLFWLNLAIAPQRRRHRHRDPRGARRPGRLGTRHPP